MTDEAPWKCIQFVSSPVFSKLTLFTFTFLVPAYKPSCKVHEYWIWCQLSLSSPWSLHANLVISEPHPHCFCWSVWLLLGVPTLTILSSFQHPAAILICLENSFWNQSKTITFIESFQEAFKLYTQTGVREKAETSIKLLEDYPPQYSSTSEPFQSALLKTLLQHRLCVLGYLHSDLLINNCHLFSSC